MVDNFYFIIMEFINDISVLAKFFNRIKNMNESDKNREDTIKYIIYQKKEFFRIFFGIVLKTNSKQLYPEL